MRIFISATLVKNIFYLSEGRGRFKEATFEAGLSGCHGFGAGACFLDADMDGDLDLFVANYVGFEFEEHQITHMNGYPVYVGPLNYPSTQNLYYENIGGGHFRDQSSEAGLAGLSGAGMGVIASDLDNDGDMDEQLNSFLIRALDRNKNAWVFWQKAYPSLFTVKRQPLAGTDKFVIVFYPVQDLSLIHI